jgi:hypothetical protein
MEIAQYGRESFIAEGPRVLKFNIQNLKPEPIAHEHLSLVMCDGKKE